MAGSTTGRAEAGLPRLFEFERIRRAEDDAAENAFLAELCAYGMRLLSVQENWSETIWEEYKVAHTIFRHRTTGPLKLARNLNSARDYFAMNAKGQQQCLVPGIDLGQKTHGTPSKLTKTLFEACKSHGRAPNVQSAVRHYLYACCQQYRPVSRNPIPPSDSASLNDRYRAYLDSIQAGAGLGRRTPCLLSDPLAEENLTSDSIGRYSRDVLEEVSSWDLVEASQALPSHRIACSLRNALIGHHGTSDDYGAVRENREKYTTFSAYDRLLDELKERVRSSSRASFDAWCLRSRTRAFKTLLSKQPIAQSDDAELLLKSLAILQWRSLGLMARCYGQTVAMMNADFGPWIPGVSPMEESIFSTVHLRHPACAGFPLVFLGRAQRAWVCEQFVETMVDHAYRKPSPQSTEGNTDRAATSYYDMPVVPGL